MKPSKWAIIGGAVLIISCVVGYEAKVYLEKKRSFENLFIQTVSPLIKGTAEVGRIRFGFLSAHLQEVRLLIPGRSLAIAIKDIRISISISRLFRTHFSLGRSIGKIVLVEPAIDLTFPLPDSGNADRRSFEAQRSLAARLSRQFGIDYLRVKDGTLRVHDSLGRVSMAAEDLDGRVHGNDSGLFFSIKGRLAAAKERNFFLNGEFAESGGEHHIAVRLEKTELRTPLQFNSFALTAGTLSGVCDFVLPDSAITLSTIRTTGNVTVSHARFKVAGLQKEIAPADLSILCHGSRITLGALSAKCAHATISASGTWDLAGDPAACRIHFQCSGIRTDSLGFGQKKHDCHKPSPELSMSGDLLQGSDHKPLLCAQLTGFMKKGGLFARAKIEGNELALDSLFFHAPSCMATGTGRVNFQGSPTYSINYSGRVDSIGVIDNRAAGTIRFAGTLEGSAESPHTRLTLEGENLGFGGMTLGSLRGTAQSVGENLIFKANANSGSALWAAVSGMIQTPFACNPKASCTLSVRTTGSNPIFAHLGSRRPDTLTIGGTLNGWADAYRSHLYLHASGAQMSGDLSLRLSHNGSGRRPQTSWELRGDRVSLFGAPSTCTGSGRLIGDSLVIDSLAVLDRAVVFGSVKLSNPVRLNTECRYDFAIKDLLRLASKGYSGIDSGRVYGYARFMGQPSTLWSRIEAHLRGGKINGIGEFRTDAIAYGKGSAFTVLPLVLRKDGRVIASFDTMTNAPQLRLSGGFNDLDLAALFGPILEDFPLSGAISGSFHSSPEGLPIAATVSSRRIDIAGRQLDSVSLNALIDRGGIKVVSLHSCDGPRTVMNAQGYVPFSFLAGDESDHDTLRADISAKGDLIATLHNTVSPLIDGSGQGTLDVSISGRPDNWHIGKAVLSVPSGSLTLKPYIPGKITAFSCRMTVNDSSLVNVAMSGMAGKRSMRVFSTHAIPAGYKPIIAGPFDFGILQVESPEHGVEVYVPGMVETGEVADIEPLGKPPFRCFSLAGPIASPRVCGTLVARNTDFTYPFAAKRRPSSAAAAAADTSDEDDEPKANFFSTITWDLDIRVGDRKVMYFRDIGGNNAPIMRMLEAYVDQGSSLIHIEGADYDNSLKVKGSVHAYRGKVYFGKTFDRNVEVGIEFIPQKHPNTPGYDNMPILWGTAEAAADTSRIDRIKITALVMDPVSGAVSERGRLCIVNGLVNIQLHMSSDLDEIAGASEREFYRQAGVQFTSVGGAGKFVSGFGEQYLNRYFLQRMERRLARSIGLDVIAVETNIASNYFNRYYNRQFENVPIQYDYLALANMGITVGRYIFGDNVFLKASGGLLPLNDTALTPQYSFGLELQPLRYFFMDVDYGFYKGDVGINHNLQYQLQLRIPIRGVRDLFDF